MCSDAKGDVFITAEIQSKSGARTGYVYEYAHGGKSPIATLDVPSHEIPVNCSSDPTTGNLAVTSYDFRNYAPLVEIYTGGSGEPRLYHSAGAWGRTRSRPTMRAATFSLPAAETWPRCFRKASNGLKKLTLNETIGNVAHAQWDGKYFALQSYAPTRHNGENIFEHYYRVQVSGTTGKIVGISRFDDWRQKNPGQSWIQSDTLVATPNNAINFWKYPAGGRAFKVLHPSDPSQAITVSLAR